MTILKRRQNKKKSGCGVRYGLCLLSFLLVTSLSRPSGAAPMREFIMACTYGVLAGTLVGAASLAFTRQPGENLNRVARGASLGLYSGILLGAYVIYVVPGQIKKEQEQFEQEGLPPPEGEIPEEAFHFHLLPLIGQRGLEGVGAQATLLRF